MKNLELEKMGVQEMNNTEMNEHTGGISVIPVIVAGVVVVVLYVIGFTMDIRNRIMRANSMSTR